MPAFTNRYPYNSWLDLLAPIPNYGSNTPIDGIGLKFTVKAEDTMDDKINLFYYSPYEPKKVIFSNPATIVMWRDGTKTVVKCQEGEKFDEYTGFCIAFTKKFLDTNSKIKSIVENAEHTISKGRTEKALDKRKKLLKKVKKMEFEPDPTGSHHKAAKKLHAGMIKINKT